MTTLKWKSTGYGYELYAWEEYPMRLDYQLLRRGRFNGRGAWDVIYNGKTIARKLPLDAAKVLGVKHLYTVTENIWRNK